MFCWPVYHDWRDYLTKQSVLTPASRLMLIIVAASITHNQGPQRNIDRAFCHSLTK